MITVDTTIEEITNDSFLREFAPYLIYSPTEDGAGNFTDKSISLLGIQERNKTWSANDMAYGLNGLRNNLKHHEKLLYPVYTKEEIDKDPTKACVNVTFFPAQAKTGNTKKFAILVAGGGYGAVCSLAEAYPVATKLAERGIPSFCLNYRVGGEPPLFPKPMEDLAAAYAFIKQNADKFDVNPEHYVVGGFSAGGHLAACYGTKELGYLKYGYTAPEALLLNYPLIAVWRTVSTLPESYSKIMLATYFGQEYSEVDSRLYNIEENIFETYPPVFLIHAENDGVVPVWNSRELTEVLEENNIPYVYEQVKEANHGYGLGSDTDAAGWVDRAIAFWKQVR